MPNPPIPAPPLVDAPGSTPSLRTLGTNPNQAASGSDSRLDVLTYLSTTPVANGVPRALSSGQLDTGWVPAATATAAGLVSTTAQSFAGDKTFLGRVGIGTASPNYKLYVLGGANDGIKVQVPDGNSSNAQVVLSAGLEPALGQGAVLQLNAPSSSVEPNALFLFNRTNGPMVFATSNTERLRIAGDGSVGIGTTAPQALLHVQGAAKVTGSLTLDNGPFVVTNSDSTPVIRLRTSNTAAWENLGDMSWGDSNHVWAWSARNGYSGWGYLQYAFNWAVTSDGGSHWNNVLTAYPDGRVAMGDMQVNENPTSKLYVRGVIESSSGGFKFPDGTTQTTAASGSGSSVWSLAGQDAYYTAGNVGIGTSSPTGNLDVNGPLSILARAQSAAGNAECLVYDEQGANYAGFIKRGSLATGNMGLPVNSGELVTKGGALGIVINGNGSTAPYLAFGTGPGPTGDKIYERMRITNDGKIGINTANPASTLTVAGVIESTSGGVKFPDGTTLTTANMSSPTNMMTTDTTQSSISGAKTFTTTVNSTVNSSAGGFKVTTSGNLTYGFVHATPSCKLVTMLHFGLGHMDIGTIEGAVPLALMVNGGEAVIFDTDYKATFSGQVVLPAAGIKFSDNSTLTKAPAGSQWTSGTGLIYYNGGKVGIGDTNPAEQLTVAGNIKLTGTGNGLVFPDGTTQTTASSGSLWTASGQDIYYNSGKVGVNVNAPTSTLHVKQSSGAQTYVTQFHALNQSPWLAGFFNDAYSTTTPVFEYFAYNDGTFAMGTPSGKDLSLYTGGYNSPKLTILSGGNVGIGTTLPGSKLTVAGVIETTSGGIRFPDGSTMTTANGITIPLTLAKSSGLSTAFGSPYLNIGGGEWLANSIQSVGFGYRNGSPPPGEIGFLTTSTSGNTYGDLVFATRPDYSSTAATERMRITSAGKVGINTSNVFAGTLMVSAGASNALGGDVWIVNSSGTTTGTASARLAFGVDGTTDTTPNFGIEAVGNGSSSQADLVFKAWDGSNYNEKFRIKSNGNIAAPVTIAGTTTDTVGHLVVSRANGGGLGGQLTIRNPISGQVGTSAAIAFEIDNTTAFNTDGTSASNIELRAYKESTNNASALLFSTYNGTTVGERMRLTSDGKVGIGATSPSSLFHVASTTAAVQITISSTAGDAGVGLDAGTGKNPYVDLKVNGTIKANLFYDAANDWFAINDRGTKTLINPNSGNVGIGLNNPTEKLHVNGNIATSGYLKFTSDTPILYLPPGNASQTGNYVNVLNMVPSGANLNGEFMVRPSGTATNAAIYLAGTSSPDTIGAPLFCFGGGFGGARSGTWAFGSVNLLQPNTASRDICFVVSSVARGRVEALTIASSGYVGVNKTDPSEALEVTGNIKASGTVTSNGAACSRWRGVLSSAPTSTVAEGDMYFNSGDSKVYLYANSSWVVLN